MRMRVYRDSISQPCADATRNRTSRLVGQGSMSSSNSRRTFLVHGAAAGSVCLLTFTLPGCKTKLTPAQARAAGVPLHALAAGDVATLDALGETLLPGSAAAGLAQ